MTTVQAEWLKPTAPPNYANIFQIVLCLLSTMFLGLSFVCNEEPNHKQETPERERERERDETKSQHEVIPRMTCIAMSTDGTLSRTELKW
jgi:hypothetical protein